MRSVAALFVLFASTLLAVPAEAQMAPRPWLGVQIQNGARGVLVSDVIPGTPADLAGMNKGDVITKVDAAAVRTTVGLITAIARHRVGDTVSITVVRKGKAVKVKALLERRLSADELIKRRLVGQRAPDFALPVMTGGGARSKLRLSSFLGKVVVLEFWSKDCGHCRAIHPSLAALQKKYKPEGLVVLGPADDNVKGLQAYLAKHALGFTTLHDAGSVVKNKYFVVATPTLVVVDRTGIVRYAGIGSNVVNQVADVTRRCLKKL